MPHYDKPHLAKFCGAWYVTHNSTGVDPDWLDAAIQWAHQKNRLIFDQSFVGKLNLRYNPDRHGAIK